MKAVNWKLGLSSACKKDVSPKTFKEYAQNGIEYMEVSLKHGAYTQTDWKQVKQSSKESGVKLWSFHMPFAPFAEFNIATLDAKQNKAAIEIQKKILETASELQIPIAVIHPSGEPNSECDRQVLLEIASQGLAELAERAAQLGVTIAVEDLPRTCLGNCSDDIKKLISYNDKLRVCFDTNHLLIQSNLDFIKEVGDKIVTLHVSDYDFLDERHWLPYEGKNRWIDIVTALENVDYNGVFMYEVGFDCPDTITRRKLTYSDFVENHKACVNKVPYEAFGRVNAEVCAQKSYFKIPKIN